MLKRLSPEASGVQRRRSRWCTRDRSCLKALRMTPLKVRSVAKSGAAVATAILFRRQMLNADRYC